MPRQTLKQKAVASADAELNSVGLPSYSQLLAFITQGVTSRMRTELNEDVRRNPGATDCGTFVLMTPAAWGAITVAEKAIDQ